MASLLTIPLELLVAVSSFLSTPELGALRLTCKQIEKSLYEWFSKEFFTKKQFMLTHESLQALFDISKHAGFSQKLSHVIIATNVYANKHIVFRDKDAAARYCQGYNDQRTLLNTGVDREMLTESFKNLKNLQTVGIRDFNNHERSRDGINWTSWAAPTVYQETGVELDFSTSAPYTPHEAQEFLARVFQSVVYALGKADQHAPELEILLRHHFLPDSAFNIPNFVYPAVEGFLSGLKKLLLRTNTSRTNNSFLHTSVNANIAELHAGGLLRRFLACTPNLTHLRLNFPKYQQNDNQQFLQWLALTDLSTESQTDDFFDPPAINLAHLTALDLGQFQVRPPVVLNLVAKFAPTLRNLELWKISLYEDASTTGFAGRDAKQNEWSKFFAKLAKVPQLQLTHLKVGMLSQEHSYVQFKVSDNENVPLQKVKAYTGTKMDAFLKELTDQVTIPGPPENLVADQNASDEDEDDEDDDEDEEMADDDDDEDDSDEYGDDA